MKYEPHDYQKYAGRYIEEHPIAAVLLDMVLFRTLDDASIITVYEAVYYTSQKILQNICI